MKFQNITSKQVKEKFCQELHLLESYILCKAGRGRSVTVVSVYQNLATKEAAYVFVKKVRPQLNLNEN